MRRLGAAAAALVVLVAAAVLAPPLAPTPPDHRPNVLIVLTDDQSLDTLPSHPAAMPWLQSQLFDPRGHWLWFPNAVASTPLCCPSRSTILTGQYDTRTGVRTNFDGALLDDTNTLPVWLHDGGYHTGLVGKYLNEYPWGRAPFVPPGWDRWFAKESVDESTSYYNYDIADQTIARHYGAVPSTYATDVLGEQAVDFVREAPVGQPWFLYFSPNAPHLPWIPAPRYEGAFRGVDVPIPPLAVLNDVAGKPAYVREEPPNTKADRRRLEEDNRNERAMLRSVDDWFRAIVDAVAARGELDNTVIVFLTDNGYDFGLHRLEGKRYPYEPSIGLPFAIRTPWAPATTVRDLVSNLDLAGTIASIAGVPPGRSQDGVDLSPALHGGPIPHRAGVLLDWVGDHVVPAWQGVRTPRYLYVRNADGTEELYRTSDRFQLHNLAGEPEAGDMVRRARSLLAVLSAKAHG